MLKTAVYMIVGVVVFLFAVQNMEIVSVHVLTGRAIQMPLIMVIGFSFLAGLATAILGVIRKAIRRNRKRNEAFMEPRRGV